jgi:hypothetical protein
MAVFFWNVEVSQEFSLCTSVYASVEQSWSVTCIIVLSNTNSETCNSEWRVVTEVVAFWICWHSNLVFPFRWNKLALCVIYSKHVSVYNYLWILLRWFYSEINVMYVQFVCVCCSLPACLISVRITQSVFILLTNCIHLFNACTYWFWTY